MSRLKDEVAKLTLLKSVDSGRILTVWYLEIRTP